MEEDNLHCVAEPANATGNVVFIHGVDGHWKETWHPYKQPNSYWPQWVAEDNPTHAVYSVHYNVATIKWRGEAMPLSERARSVYNMLDIHGVWKRPTVFVVHSFGGLVAKQMWREINDRKLKEAKRNWRGVVFLGTPHVGAFLGDYLNAVFIRLMARPNVVMDELRFGGSQLINLDEWYANNPGDHNWVYFEELPTHGLMVVNKVAARLAGTYPVGVMADHPSLAKPASKKAILYLSVDKNIKEAFA